MTNRYCSSHRYLSLAAMASAQLRMEVEMWCVMTTQKSSPNNRGNKTSFSQPDRRTTFGAGANLAHVSHSYRQSRTSLCGFLILSICFVSFVQRTLAQDIDAAASNVFHHPGNLHDPDEHSHLDDPNERNRHVGLTGKPCIALESRATAQRINKNIYEHWITASNSCGQNIKLQVCYHKTDDCIVMNVPPYENTNAVLGIQPSMKEFQYDAKEK
jgi:hypothetical protein